MAAGPRPEVDISTLRTQRTRYRSLQTLLVRETCHESQACHPPLALRSSAACFILPRGKPLAARRRKPLVPRGTAPAQKPDKNTDACALLTRAEIQVVQSEPVEEPKPSVQPSGGFVMLQCFYHTTTSAKSVSLALGAPRSCQPSALTPREFWRKQFHLRAGGGRKARCWESSEES